MGTRPDQGTQSHSYKATPLSEANLRAHNDMHAAEPTLARYQAFARLTNTAAAARSLGIHHDVVLREGVNQIMGDDPMERFRNGKDLPSGRVSTTRENGQQDTRRT